MLLDITREGQRMLKKFFRMLFGHGHRDQIVRQARAESSYAAQRSSGIIKAKVNYLDTLVKQFQEDTRR